MSKGIIILGNGFDLDLGLKTRYSDFVKSPQWKQLMDKNPHSKGNDFLLGYLDNKYELERWIDIERSLLEYATNRTAINRMTSASRDSADFPKLRQALRAYLKEQQEQFAPTTNSVARALLPFLAEITTQSRIYTFNYTQLNVLAGKCGVNMPKDAIHIHGSLADDEDIILGIETENRIDDRYAFLFKTQSRQYKHTDILKDLKERDEYIFYGHSLNGMDFAYFNSVFSTRSLSTSRTPRLTIITKDVESENLFKNSLRSEYISLQGLYSNSNPVFILTDLVYQKNPAEIKKVKELLERMGLM